MRRAGRWGLCAALAALGVLALAGAGDGAPDDGRAAATRLASVPPPDERRTGTLSADLGRSVVRWTGTKFRGRGRHEGTVSLAEGTLALCGARACGGRFVLDMRSIAVTDIPAEDPVPRTRLTNHLKSRDFFWVERHPTATFTLRQATPGVGGAYRVAGELTLRGVTRPLAFPATLDEAPGGERRVSARVRIDRQRWGVEYRFDPIRNEIVDDDIQLDLTIVFPPNAAPAGRGRAWPGVAGRA